VTLEIAVLGPALLLLVFAIVQASMWFFARNLALAAAQEGVAAGRAYLADPGAASREAQAWLERNAGDSLRGASVSTSAWGQTVRVEVTGKALAVLPGWAGPTVRQSAEGPVERFTVAGSP
jgi:hypothetical protein